MSFWTTESLEVMNMLTYGGVETAQYPIAVYQKYFQRFFTFVVPLAMVTYFPILAVLDISYRSVRRGLGRWSRRPPGSFSSAPAC